MSPAEHMETFEIFGKQIRYDPSKPYGLVAEDQYGHFPGENFPKIAKEVGKDNFLQFLDLQIEMLKNEVGKEKRLEILVEEGILPVKPYELPQEEKEAIQNSIDLFEYMMRTIRS